MKEKMKVTNEHIKALTNILNMDNKFPGYMHPTGKEAIEALLEERKMFLKIINDVVNMQGCYDMAHWDAEVVDKCRDMVKENNATE